MTRYASIISTGAYLPEIEVTNAAMKERFGVVIDKFEASSGIKTRFYAPPDWATSDLAVEAGKKALANAGLNPEDLGLIILGTDSPDYITPATSVVVQHKLGAKNAGTFDVGCACASFPTGLNLAAGLISANPGLKYVMVIGAYMMHKLADLENDVMSFFYGDGAGAAILTASEKPGFVSSTFAADGSYHKHWGIYSGGTYEPVSEDSLKAGRTKVKLITPFPPEVNHEGWPARMRELAKNGNFDLQEADLVIYTQVRLGSIKLVQESLGLPFEKAHFVMDRFGYTGSACLPMAFDDAVSQGKVHSGDLVLFVGSGVGYNQAGSAFIMP
ncbi:MAG TPA: ketoacyl-ACP synthase III [Anaerolineaceae bacterium]|nr:ketoacyl-ACP synthase III [Anaerolineaceae bacterium]